MPRKHEEPVTTCPPADATFQVETVLQRPTRGRRQPTEARPLDRPARSGLPRVTRLMAVAIKCQDMVDRGEIRDYADLARLGHVTRARMSQIMNLLLLAPDIQHAILEAPPAGHLPPERHLRQVASRVNWSEQRRAWRGIAGDFEPGGNAP